MNHTLYFKSFSVYMQEFLLQQYNFNERYGIFGNTGRHRAE